jgi:sugar/nucleoside kinase (ribokinase family)
MKILGMGNALVDIMTQLKDDSILKKFNFPKGGMTLVDIETSSYLMNETFGLSKVKTSGGSAANTIHGLAHLGVETSFIGKIGHDDLGSFFKKDMKATGINPILFNSITETGRVIAMISRDSERTMATFLGASVELEAQDLSSDIFKGYNFFYVEGYLVQNKELITKALRLAKHTKLKICLDLASFTIVLENIDFLKETISEYVDIVFANEEEVKALTGKSTEAALIELAGLCDIAIVKLGPQGSIIRNGEQTIRIDATQSIAIDTTGAGDLYAAGFLFGIGNNYSVQSSAEIGSILAGHVIEIIGAKMEESTWELIRRKIKKIHKD